MTDWSQAWLALVEGSDPRVARRLHQGRSYHRAGRVTDLRVQAGGASVRVQGDRATPFAVSVTVPQLSDAAWEQVVGALAGQVRHTARLLAGHAPDSLDAELEGTGVRIVPTLGELEVSCDCNDATWPCGHVAALWEALAQRFDEDPFTLLRMRGRGRERLMSELAAVRRRRHRGDVSPGVALEQLDTSSWTVARRPLDALTIPDPTPPPTPAGSLRLLGDPPGWSGGVDAWKLLAPRVEAAAEWIQRLDESD